MQQTTQQPIISASFRAVILFVAALLAGVSQSQAQAPQVFSRFGRAQVQGQDVIVHVTVAVPFGTNPDQATLNALGEQGARPFQPDEFSTTGLVWDQFSDSNQGNDRVIQSYNPANQPTGSAQNALTNTHFTWSQVPTSKFTFQAGDLNTARCPSLVKECRGPQNFDGYNDVAWLPIGGCCTLAVTWSSSSTDEADMAINTNFSWASDTTQGEYDLESVILHENGHVAGLGHSGVAQAVMYAYYSGLNRSLHADDIGGITFLYPADGSTGSISGTVTDSSNGSGISGATVSVGALSATTDPSGNYTISQVPEGTSHTVTAKASGYFDGTVSNVVVTAGSDTPGVNFSLALDETALTISNVSSQTSGKGGAFKITWTTNKPATSEVIFTCCGTYTDNTLVTSHSMSFRGTKGSSYIYTVKSTDALGNTTEAGPFQHNN